MEEVAHGVHEDHAGRPPPVGELQQVFVQCEAEAGAAVLGVAVVLIPGIAHGLQTLRQRERVAVVAAVRVRSQRCSGSKVVSVHSMPVRSATATSFLAQLSTGYSRVRGYEPGTTGAAAIVDPEWRARSTRARIDQLTGAVFTVRGSGHRELGLQGIGRVGVEAALRPLRHGARPHGWIA